ncbi:J domain-containing protein [Micromonospora sp. WMMD882]|uniref:J domain-containing protein n=1 Tax=Micromonospora sp. WMMD882 TaxID=3015151 RepID=UPI00248C3503|nr:J domain-containing protein [Micromonospora sp. WMMD882]WBB82101.1 J domain-containing protein [Micromonospora sp. WMMD882]
MRSGEYMLPDGQDPYALLGVGRDASLPQIRERYHILVQIWHPDKHESSNAKVREEATRQMQLINAAYQLIKKDHDRRTRAPGAGEQQREKRDREARERRAREQRAQEEREQRNRERQAREREARELQPPRAQWTHPEHRPGDWAGPPTIELVRITSSAGDEGHTLRAYFDRHQKYAAFLGFEGELLLFRSEESLHRYLTDSGAHDLADAPGWDGFMNWFLGSTKDRDDDRSFDFDLILTSIGHPPATWLPQLFVANRDLILEIAEAFEVHQVLGMLRAGSALDTVDDLLRLADRPFAGRGARRRLDALHPGPVVSAWRQTIRHIESRIRWLR